MLGGLTNLGITGLFWSLPFWVLFFLRILRYGSKNTFIAFVVIALVSVPLLFKESNPLFFPSIGSEIELRGDTWVAHRFEDSDYYSLWKRENEEDDYYVVASKLINESKTLTMTSVSISHPDFSTSLWPVFVDENDIEYIISERSLLIAIEEGSIYSDDLGDVSHIQSRRTYYLGFSMAWPYLFLFPFL